MEFSPATARKPSSILRGVRPVSSAAKRTLIWRITNAPLTQHPMVSYRTPLSRYRESESMTLNRALTILQPRASMHASDKRGHFIGSHRLLEKVALAVAATNIPHKAGRLVSLYTLRNNRNI